MQLCQFSLSGLSSRSTSSLTTPHVRSQRHTSGVFGRLCPVGQGSPLFAQVATSQTPHPSLSGYQEQCLAIFVPYIGIDLFSFKEQLRGSLVHVSTSPPEWCLAITAQLVRYSLFSL